MKLHFQSHFTTNLSLRRCVNCMFSYGLTFKHAYNIVYGLFIRYFLLISWNYTLNKMFPLRNIQATFQFPQLVHLRLALHLLNMCLSTYSFIRFSCCWEGLFAWSFTQHLFVKACTSKYNLGNTLLGSHSTRFLLCVRNRNIGCLSYLVIQLRIISLPGYVLLRENEKCKLLAENFIRI